MPDRVEHALELAGLGWNVVAAPPQGKTPVGSWKRFQAERVPERELRETVRENSNLFVITGSVSQLAVLDCDDEISLRWWRDRLGPVMDQTTQVNTSKGRHHYFRLRPGQIERSRASDGGPTGKWDLQAEGKGVIVPPSVHESGRRYEWVPERGPEALQDAPAALWERNAEEAAKEGSGGTRSMLSHLLSNPSQEGGRNNWLTSVAGHYAKHIPHKDAFETLVWDAASKLTDPLPDFEVEKTIASIWQSEQAKSGTTPEPVDEEEEEDAWRANLLEPTEDTGWLASGGSRILVQVRKRDAEGNVELGLGPWMDADARVLGVVQSDTDQVYGIELRFPDGHRVEDHLPARAVSDPRQLYAWLARHGASIGPPDNIWPAKMRDGTRFLRYLRAQGAEEMEAADALGWHRGSRAFVTHDGLIRAEGPQGFEHVRPDPSIRGWAPYRYGFEASVDEAQRVLLEVLSFHDEQVAAVFGSWWAATFLKPQLQERASQFPFMAMEASSESGKTTGFFPLMMQLAGNRSGQNNPTRAALRDYLSAHHNGIVWVDDLDDLDDMGELLRNVTVGGSLVKKGDGNHAQVVAQLRAALVVSGESLGLHDQKALVDRCVLLDVPSPTERRSTRGDYPQWDDIVSLRNRYPDLTQFAGWMVQLALRSGESVQSLRELRYGTGRHADALAIVRVGARVLHAMTGGRTTWAVERVDAWVESEVGGYHGAENVLTLKLLPRALRSTGWRSKPYGPDPDRRTVSTPAFVDDGIVWFSPRLLAEWWEREPPINKRLNPRVESATALEQQARELGLGGKKGDGRRDFRLMTGEGSQRYWRATPALSELIVARSRGEVD